MSKWMMSLALLALAGQPLSAQVIEGRVVESRGGRPLSNATVTVLDAEGNSVGMAGTDGRGEFRVRLNAPGRYTLRTDAIGYLTSRSGMMNVREGREVYRTVGLRTARRSPDRNIGGVVPPRGAPGPVPTPPIPTIPPGRDTDPSTSVAPSGDAERPGAKAVVQPRRGAPSTAPRPRTPGGGAKRGGVAPGKP